MEDYIEISGIAGETIFHESYFPEFNTKLYDSYVLSSVVKHLDDECPLPGAPECVQMSEYFDFQMAGPPVLPPVVRIAPVPSTPHPTTRAPTESINANPFRSDKQPWNGQVTSSNTRPLNGNTARDKSVASSKSSDPALIPRLLI